MFKILKKNYLNEQVVYMLLEAPLIANNAQAGQFLILRVDERGERIPLTIFEADKTRGTVGIVYQKVGFTTYKLDAKNAGDYILDVVGPLGKASELSGYNKAILVSGGVGAAIAYPIAKALHQSGCRTDIILGFRNEKLIILEKEMAAFCNNIDTITDDGSNGRKGFVTDILREKLAVDKNYDVVFSVGPLPMMKAVCDITKNHGIKSVVSMTAIMIDGTGMCGGCRLTVGGKTKFACVDGPDFDGHEVDFDEAMARSRTFKKQEDYSRERHCNLFKGGAL